MKTVFKLEDKVYHILYGWGCITEIADYSITVDFNGEQVFGFSDDKLFSFTEYSLQGFSQERPIELPEVGELCLVRDYNEKNWKLKKFSDFNPSGNYPYRVGANRTGYKQLKRIKILD
jgi:hypothetical protein